MPKRGCGGAVAPTQRRQWLVSPLRHMQGATPFVTTMTTLLNLAAVLCAAFIPHMTKPSVASKQTEANHPVACPLQWLPVILAANTPVATTNGRRLSNHVFATKAELTTALKAWNSNPSAAEATYGPIADFDVSGITDMSWLFAGLLNIDEDISSWNTSGVTDMDHTFAVRCLAPTSSREPSPACG